MFGYSRKQTKTREWMADLTYYQNKKGEHVLLAFRRHPGQEGVVTAVTEAPVHPGGQETSVTPHHSWKQ